MEPFTMMLGYGLVNSISQLVVRPIADKISQPGRKEEMLFQMNTKQKLDMESVRLNKQLELENNLNIQEFSHRCRLAEAQKQFDSQLKMWELGQFNNSMWPLLTPFNHPSLKPQLTSGNMMPLNVFMAKTDPRSPFATLLQADVKNRLSNFLQTTYANSIDHPCICRIGDWKDGFQDAAFINALWYGMQGQPCIVLNPIQSQFGEQLDLNVSIWGLASNGYTPITQTVISGPFGIAIGRYKREETLKWKQLGMPVSTPEMKHNISLLEQEDQLLQNGHNQDVIDLLLPQYKLPKEIQNPVINRFSKEYSLSLACVTGMFADIYHLMEYGSEPYMPVAINSYNLNSDSAYQIPEMVIHNYRKALTSLTCSNYLQNKLPFTYLKVARALQFDKSNSMEIFQEGVGLWANRKQDGRDIKLPENIDSCIGLLRENSDSTDKNYLEMTRSFLVSIGEEEAAKEIGKKIYTLPEPISRPVERSSEVEVQVKDLPIFNETVFFDYIREYRDKAIKLSAIDAVFILRENYGIMAFADSESGLVCDETVGIVCVRADNYCLNTEFNDERVIVYNIINNNFTNSHHFMQNKKFDSFEKLGKQLDALVNNVKRIVDPVKQNPAPQAKQEDSGDDFLSQLSGLFSQDNLPGLETQALETADLNSIKLWLQSKLPLPNVSKAHLVQIPSNGKIMLCVLYSDEQNNALLTEEYPKLRVDCDKINSDLEVFFNGLSIGTIKF